MAGIPFRYSRLLRLGGAFVVLAVGLLGLFQYRLLGRLHRASAESRLLAAEALAGAISDGVPEYFAPRTDKLLDLTDEEFHDDAAVASRFARYTFAGAREVFIVRVQGGEPRVRFFDGDGQRLVERPRAGAIDAIHMAMYPWADAARRRSLRVPRSFQLELQPRYVPRINLDLIMADRRNRVVLHPVGLLDEFVGATGYIVDHDYVAKELLPRIIDRALKAGGEKVAGLRVVVQQSGTGRTLYGRTAHGAQSPMVRAPLSFAMADHVVEVYNDGPTEAMLASRSFAINVALAGFIVLLGTAGVILTFRATRMEIALATMKQDFVSTVTHELRTPLASIRLFGRLIRTATVANLEETRTFGAHIEEESERLTRMVGRILDLARMEGRDWRPVFAEVDLREVTHDVMQMHDGRLREEGFSVVLRLPEDPVIVSGSREVLAGALSNLIENAINYSATGVKAIDVELSEEAEIRVRDRGIGVSPGDASRIFERFYRADSEVVRSAKGAGLGLAVVRATVETHGGTITLQSRPGGGSTFTISLPRLRTAALPKRVEAG